MTRRASRTLMRVLSVTTVVGLGAYGYSHRDHTQAFEGTPASKPKGVTMLASAEGEAPLKKAEEKKGDGKPVIGAATTKPSGSPGAREEAKPASASIPADAQRVLSEGKTKIDGNELTAGRKVLNDALMGGQLAGADAVAAKQLIGEANKMLIFSPRRFNDDPWAGTHPVAPGEVLAKIALKYGVTPELLLQMNGMTDARKLRAGSTIKVLHGPFHLVISKQTFNMDIYLGSPGEKGAEFVTSFQVGLGKDDGTPAGTWIISDRIPNPKWWGARGQAPIEAGDPKNPLGKYWLALTGIDGKAEGQQSYGIHGTIEPESIGKQASMGCIRMRNEDVSVVYSLVVSGKSTVVVRD